MTENRLTLDTEREVFFYEQNHYYLSNFSSFAIETEGLVFPTVEHAYHWHKFYGLSPIRTEVQNKIFRARSAHDAYKIAQDYKARRVAEWDEIKDMTMFRLLCLKVRQHEYVRRKLLETGDRMLIENSWRDSYWGWGPDRQGKNRLGEIWMRVRNELKQKEIMG